MEHLADTISTWIIFIVIFYGLKARYEQDKARKETRSIETSSDKLVQRRTHAESHQS